MMEAALELLQDGKPARILLKGIAAEDLRILQGLNLLTSHPVLYVCNVAEADAATGNEHTRAVEKMADRAGRRHRGHLGRDRGRSRAALRRRRDGVPGLARPRRARPGQADPRRLRPAAPDHLFHRRAEGDARLDHPQGRPRRRRRPASSTPISSAASSAPRPSPTTTSSRWAAKWRPRKPARRATKARNMSSRTATCCCSSSTPDALSKHARQLV